MHKRYVDSDLQGSNFESFEFPIHEPKSEVAGVGTPLAAYIETNAIYE